MQFSIIICGLVRDSALMQEKIKIYMDWRSKGYVDKIIYSTWIGEVDHYSGLRKFLTDNGVKILEIEEPRLVLKSGHQLHQMLSLHYGLQYLGDIDQFVLKTRVDLAENPADIPAAFLQGTAHADDFLGLNFKHKILVESAKMLYPFFCSDIQFFGHVQDLRKLINLSAEMELIFNRLILEQTFFFHPFKEIAIFRRHFYWNLPHFTEIADRRDKQIAYVLETPAILEVVQSWWVILKAYFTIGWTMNKHDPLVLNSLAEAFSFDGKTKYIAEDRSDQIDGQSFIDGLMGLIEPQILRQKMMMHTFDNPFAIPRSIFNDYEKFRNQFSSLPSPKATCADSGGWIIRGAPQDFFVKAEGDTASRRYLEQITALRRENDFLQKQSKMTVSYSLTHRILNRLLPRQAIQFLKSKTPWITHFYTKYMMRRWKKEK